MQRTVFSVVVLVSLGLAALFGLIVAQPALIGGLAGDPSGGHIGQHFREPEHRVHDLAFGLLLATTAIGMVVQVRWSAQNVAGQLMAVTPILALVLAVLVTDRRVLAIPWVAVGAPTIVATMLHPRVFGSAGRTRVAPALMALIAIAAVPLVALALSNIGLQRSGTGDHAALGHYGYMAAFGLTILGVGTISSLRLAGWRLTAWVTGALAILIGTASLVFADVEGSFGPAWALAAVGWGAVFIAVAEALRRGDRRPT